MAQHQDNLEIGSRFEERTLEGRQETKYKKNKSSKHKATHQRWERTKTLSQGRRPEAKESFWRPVTKEDLWKTEPKEDLWRTVT